MERRDDLDYYTKYITNNPYLYNNKSLIYRLKIIVLNERA
jgi:hypothetical protein